MFDPYDTEAQRLQVQQRMTADELYDAMLEWREVAK